MFGNRHVVDLVLTHGVNDGIKVAADATNIVECKLGDACLLALSMVDCW